MAPKVKLTKEQIVQTALELIHENGESAINARSIAAALECSTQPVFSNFATMEDLRYAVTETAYEIYLSFLAREAESDKYPKYKAFGMAYIRFAKEERELFKLLFMRDFSFHFFFFFPFFKLLFMRDRTGEDTSTSPDFEESAKMIAAANGVSIEEARLIHLEMWSCVHGIAVMLATSFLPLEESLISDIISDVYHGVLARHMPRTKY